MSSTLSPEEMGMVYWRRLRRAALREVLLKLHDMAKANPKRPIPQNTFNYWTAVYRWLEKQDGVRQRDSIKDKVATPVAAQ